MSDQENATPAEANTDLLPGEDLKFGDAAPEVRAANNEGDKPAADTSPDASTQTSEDGDDTPQDAPEKKKETAKERRERQRQKYQREVEEAQAKADEAIRRADQIRRAGESSAEPKEGDFASYDDFIAAKAVWAYARQDRDSQASQADREAEAARQQAEAIRQQDKALLAQSWEEQKAEAAQKYTDFNDVVLRPGLFPQGNHLPDLIMGSENAADLAYKVAQDQSLHDRLVAMHPFEAARELGRLEATITAPAPRVETQAPPPITPVRPRAAANADPSRMSYSDYVAARKAGRIK